jgi:UDP-N-acetylmuramoyl-L-alanyl-D-glutamate--2,6-diaminopimelate ligase
VTAGTQPRPTHRAGVDGVTLAELLPLAGQGRIAGAGGSVALTDVTHDSRTAGAGVLFACRRGEHVDGHDFAGPAVAAGSPALLVEHRLNVKVPQLVVGSVVDVLGPIAARVHGDPSHAMHVFGVTGTNGKTTVTFVLDAIAQAAGAVTGLIGTVQTLVAGEAAVGVRTTPEASDLQRLLHQMRDRGVTSVAMEVSSHGLALKRVDGTRFGVVAFTNLSQDHLDFHADLEDYFTAKARLFTRQFSDVGVVNVDDPYGRRLALSAPIDVVKVSATGAAGADVTASDIELAADGSTFVAHLLGRSVRVRSALPADFNVANVLLALAAAEAMGVDPETAAEGVARCRGVPGRMERVDVGQPFTVLVDYAHTPDSVEHVLQAARRLTDGRVIAVIGCGGDRDAGKRALMGRAAAEAADVAILTSDNPRSEDPDVILEAVVRGAASVRGAQWRAIADRRAAIAEALSVAADKDVVVIAGKGHETTQEIAGRKLPFDDRQVAAELLTAGLGGREVGG